jgi:hypothetical protein
VASWGLGAGASTLLPTWRRASSAAGDWLVAGVGAGGGELAVGGWLGTGSWRLYTLANFEESELRGWELAPLHSCQL